jgi:cathepsin A (carboxypeptidase C)
MQILLKTYPKFAKLPFHVTGESYAGHYIPAIGKTIADGNAKLAKRVAVQKGNTGGIQHIHLESLAIGNGLTDPLTQYKYYPDMACDTKYGPVLDEATCESMRSKYSTCRGMIDACYKWKSAFTCV